MKKLGLWFLSLGFLACSSATSDLGGKKDQDTGGSASFTGIDEDGSDPISDAVAATEDGGQKEPDLWTIDCVDKDGDGFGVDCLKGADCDDGNPMLNFYCPPCENGIFEGCPCSNEGSSIQCYPGDPAYLGIGECKAGSQTCAAGYWTGCFGLVEPDVEVCDGADNDCDGETDEWVLSPCGDCDPMCDTLSVGPGDPEDFDLSLNPSSGVSLDPNGFIVLDSTKVNMEHIWIANSGEHTVSKIDTKTGHELGRYYVCADPSRTAVDLFGDVWVGCRADGGVAKIVAFEGLCDDKNGNGVIETSKDANGNHVIEPSEMTANGQDECIRFLVHPGGSCQRALGVDKENHAWVGDWNGQKLRRLSPEDGSTVQEIAIPANPYGLVIDSDGVVWVSGRGGSVLVRADPATGNVQSFSPGGCFEPYGISLDYLGRVWIASCCCSNNAFRFDPTNNSWASANTSARPRGIVGSQLGPIYVANDDSNKVAIVNPDTLAVLDYVNLGSGRFPIGMTIDFEGYIWAVNNNSSSATKIDPYTKAIIGEYPTGKNPYTYSDMTGYLLHTYTSPTGFYQHLFGDYGLRMHFVAVIVDAYLPAGTYIKIRVRAAMDEASLPLEQWSEYFGPFPPETFPLDISGLNLTGQFLQVEVSLYTEDNGLSPAVKSIEVKYELGQGSD